MLMTWSSWQNTVEMYKQRKPFSCILCKTRLKLLRKGTTKWRYVILGLRLSGKTNRRAKSSIAPFVKHSVYDPIDDRTFLPRKRVTIIL